MFLRERVVGIQAVLKASHLCQSIFKQLVAGQTIVKADASPVTIADFGAQAIVNQIIHHEFPGDLIVGEEDSKDLRDNPSLCEKVLALTNSVADSPITKIDLLDFIDLGNFEGGAKGRFWTLDPIDGTKGFLRGEQYAVCLSLIIDGMVQLAVLGCPNLPHDLNNSSSSKGSIFIAVRSEGSFERRLGSDVERRIFVSKSKSAEETSFCESVESSHSDLGGSKSIASALMIRNPPIKMDSQCKYAIIARGDADIYLRIPTNPSYEEKIWDHAGGSLLVEEAGGSISDLFGKKLDFSVGRTLKHNKGILATNGIIHNQVLCAVLQVLELEEQKSVDSC